jgi:hypothetical protein
VLQRIALLGLLLAYARWLDPALAPFAAGSDASGYLWSARLFRRAALSMPIDLSDRFPAAAVGAAAFAPLATVVRPGTWDLVPTYPPGLPLHIAAAELWLPEERAVLWILRIAVVGSVWLTYRLGRAAGLSRLWAVGPAAVLACSPLLLVLAVQPMSDVLATAWSIAVVLLAWRSRRVPSSAIWAGAALGVATLIRPTNLVLIAPLFSATPKTRRHLLYVAAGGAPFALFLFAYQGWAYGNPLSSGYGSVADAFTWSHLSPTLCHYAAWIPALGSWVVLCAPGALLAWREATRPWRAIAATWIATIFGLYAFYYHTSETWWYLRFILPALPMLLVAGWLGLSELARWVGTRVPPAAAGVVPAALFLLMLAMALLQVTRLPQFGDHRDIEDGTRIPRDALRWITLRGTDDVPVFMVELSAAAEYYAPDVRLLRFDRIAADGWEAIRRWQARDRRAVRAAIVPSERKPFFASLPGRSCAWEPRDTYRGVTVWECAAPQE